MSFPQPPVQSANKVWNYNSKQLLGLEPVVLTSKLFNLDSRVSSIR